MRKRKTYFLELYRLCRIPVEKRGDWFRQKNRALGGKVTEKLKKLKSFQSGTFDSETLWSASIKIMNALQFIELDGDYAKTDIAKYQFDDPGSELLYWGDLFEKTLGGRQLTLNQIKKYHDESASRRTSPKVFLATFDIIGAWQLLMDSENESTQTVLLQDTELKEHFIQFDKGLWQYILENEVSEIATEFNDDLIRQLMERLKDLAIGDEDPLQILENETAAIISKILSSLNDDASREEVRKSIMDFYGSNELAALENYLEELIPEDLNLHYSEIKPKEVAKRNEQGRMNMSELGGTLAISIASSPDRNCSKKEMERKLSNGFNMQLSPEEDILYQRVQKQKRSMLASLNIDHVQYDNFLYEEVIKLKSTHDIDKFENYFGWFTKSLIWRSTDALRQCTQGQAGFDNAIFGYHKPDDSNIDERKTDEPIPETPFELSERLEVIQNLRSIYEELLAFGGSSPLLGTGSNNKAGKIKQQDIIWFVERMQNGRSLREIQELYGANSPVQVRNRINLVNRMIQAQLIEHIEERGYTKEELH